MLTFIIPRDGQRATWNESPLQDVKELQDILDEAKGQPGLARTRKLVSKMLKRVKAELVSVSASSFFLSRVHRWTD